MIKQAEADCLLAYERLESFSAELEKDRTAQLKSNSGLNSDSGQQPQTS